MNFINDLFTVVNRLVFWGVGGGSCNQGDLTMQAVYEQCTVRSVFVVNCVVNRTRKTISWYKYHNLLLQCA